MRTKLRDAQGERFTFNATFVRIGKKTNYMGLSEETVLLKNILKAETQEFVCDHVWLNFTRAFEKLNLREGDMISFDARIKQYTKGYVNRKIKINLQKRDYRLSHPTQIKRLQETRGKEHIPGPNN